jgi:hypothetical protein
MNIAQGQASMLTVEVPCTLAVHVALSAHHVVAGCSLEREVLADIDDGVALAMPVLVLRSTTTLLVLVVRLLRRSVVLACLLVDWKHCSPRTHSLEGRDYWDQYSVSVTEMFKLISYP